MDIPQHNKGYIVQTYRQHHTKLKAFPLKSGTRQNLDHPSTLTQYGPLIPRRSITQKKIIKGIQIGQEELMLFLFVGNMIPIILYLIDPRRLHQKTRTCDKHFQQSRKIET
jgi:hypothetical protein